MNVLVTGGAGYIGAHVVRLLRERGDHVVVLDTLERGHPAAVGDAVLIVGDIADRPLVDRLLEEHAVEAIIHLAAYTSVDESTRDPARYFRNNVGGSLALLEAALQAGVGVFIFSSSCAVYGSPKRLPVDESAPERPESPYGETKVMVERMLRWFGTSHGLRHVSLRYFNAAGAAPDGRIGEDWTAAGNLVPVVLRAAYGRGGPVRIFGTDYPTPDGTAIRDYVHVVDLADAHGRALDYLLAGGPSRVLNLGTGQGASVRQVIEVARRVAGVEIPVASAERRPGDLAEILADARRARAVLGWEPRFDLEEMVGSAWRWHSAHPDGYATAATARPPSRAPRSGRAAPGVR